MSTTQEMVEKFQCPGCVIGSDTQCGKFEIKDNDLACSSHVLGTSMGVGNSFALGMPKGFNKPGYDTWSEHQFAYNKMAIRFWKSGEQPEWDWLNIPVWVMEQDGFLFVRTYAPRINMGWVDVIEGGKVAQIHGFNPVDIGEHFDEID